MLNPFGWLRKIFAKWSGGTWRDDPAWQMRWPLPYEVSGVNLTNDEALSVSAVWACIEIISKSIAACRWNIFQPGPNDSRQQLTDHPTAWLLNTRPNPDMTAIAFREAMLMTAISQGNGYAEIVPDRAGRVAEIWPLMNDRVLPGRDYETGRMYYRYFQQNGEVIRIEPERMFHLRGPGLSGLLGENIIARAIKSISVAAAQERYSASFFGHGAQPSGVLEVPGTISPERHKLLKDDWAEKRGGPETAHKPLILEAGWKWQNTSIEPEKAQLVEGRQFSVEEICRWFGVPPHKIQHLLRATFSNIEHQSIEFVRDALTPWARRLEQEADYKFFRQDRGPWKNTEIDTAPLSAGDFQSRAAGYAIMRQNGVMTANEIRRRERMNDVGAEGDVLLVQSNLTTVELLMNPPKPPAPAAPPPADPGQGGNPPPADDKAAGAGALVHEAIVALFAGPFERYSRRLAARRADLERAHPAERVEALLVEERARLRPRLESECAPAISFACKARLKVSAEDVHRLACTWLDSGMAPAEAAAALCAGEMRA